MRSVAGLALISRAGNRFAALHGIAQACSQCSRSWPYSPCISVTPASLQYKTDWPLFVSATVLPGLITSFAQALPEFHSLLSNNFEPGLLLPAMLCLRTILPARALMLLSLVLGLALSAQYDQDLLSGLCPSW